MKSSYSTKMLAVCLSLLCLLCISGVFAAWQYCEMPLGSAADNLILNVGIFKWQGSDALPDDEEAGLAHANLINKLINGEGIGLNSPDSYLNEQIKNRTRYWNRDTLGSMAIRQGDSLESLFDLNTENTTFLIHMASSTTYYIFTTSLDLGENGSPNYAIDTTISPIYRTTVQKVNGTWVAVITEEGSAPSAYYEESQLIFINRSKIPSFDPDKWTATTT